MIIDLDKRGAIFSCLQFGIVIGDNLWRKLETAAGLKLFYKAIVFSTRWKKGKFMLCLRIYVDLYIKLLLAAVMKFLFQINEK